MDATGRAISIMLLLAATAMVLGTLVEGLVR